MKGHIILCGAGHNGKCVAMEFFKTHTPFVVIERQSQYIEDILEIGDIPYIQGDATADSDLISAGIHRAKV